MTDIKNYNFSVDWFSRHEPFWDAVINIFKPKRVLEIGSYEGRSSVYLIEKCAMYAPFEIHCVDTWQGGIEHQEGAAAASDMIEVEKRFDDNIEVARSSAVNSVKVIKHKKYSALACAEMISQGMGEYFDLVYIDGSHQAPDVLCDAVMAFQLLAVGGMMIFDDYLWSMEPQGREDPLNMPKPAIDGFLNLYQRKMSIIPAAPIGQIYAKKISS